MTKTSTIDDRDVRVTSVSRQRPAIDAIALHGVTGIATIAKTAGGTVRVRDGHGQPEGVCTGLRAAVEQVVRDEVREGSSIWDERERRTPSPKLGPG